MTRDPWRFVCPECGSTSTKKRSQTMPVHVESRVGHKTRTYCKKYYCHYCNTGLDTLKDKKTGELVQP